MIGNLYMGSGIRGSGVLVGPNDLLTAVHVALDTTGAFPGGEVRFAGGAITARMVNVAYMDVPSLWESETEISLTDIRYDLALVTLDRPIGKTLGWMEIDAVERPAVVQVAGYPGGLWDGQTLTTDSVVPIYDDGRGLMQFASPTVYQGSSGGPVYEIEADGASELLGLVSALSLDDATAYASLISPATRRVIEGWIAENDSVPASPVAAESEAFFARPVKPPGGAAPIDISAVRDFDGNDLGAGDDWRLIGAADVQNDNDAEWIYINPTLGRWATIGPDPMGVVDYSEHGAGGDTRVVGIYVDPLIALGEVEAGSAQDSQQRLQRDLSADRLELIAAHDFDADGFQEIYFRIADGTAWLRSIMHADGNVQYANYQSETQVEAYLSGLGYGDEVIDSVLI